MELFVYSDGVSNTINHKVKLIIMVNLFLEFTVEQIGTFLSFGSREPFFPVVHFSSMFGFGSHFLEHVLVVLPSHYVL